MHVELNQSTELSVYLFFCSTFPAEVSIPHMLSCEQLPNENLSAALDQKIVSPNRVLTDTGSFARILVGFPDLMVRFNGVTPNACMAKNSCRLI